MSGQVKFNYMHNVSIFVEFWNTVLDLNLLGIIMLN